MADYFASGTCRYTDRAQTARRARYKKKVRGGGPPPPRGLLCATSVAFHSSGLSGPTSQFLNETHDFSELVLAMVLLMDQSRSVLPLRSAKARDQVLGSCGGKNRTRAPWTFPYNLARTSSFWSARTDTWKSN